MPFVGTLTQPSVNATSSQLVAADNTRKYLYIRNPAGADTAYLKFDSAHASSEGIVLAAGQTYEPKEAPINSVWGVCGGGDATVLDVIVG